MTNLLRCALSTLLLFAFSCPLTAATPPNAPIELSADRGEVNYNKKTSHYQGNVILKQANMEIRGEELNLYFAEDNALLKMFIEGQPASFEQNTTPLPSVTPTANLTAHANRIDYELQPTRKLILSGKAVLWQGLNRFTGELIEYDFTTDIVKAHGGEAPSSRVNVTIYQQPDSQPRSTEGHTP